MKTTEQLLLELQEFCDHKDRLYTLAFCRAGYGREWVGTIGKREGSSPPHWTTEHGEGETFEQCLRALYRLLFDDVRID